jgi:uncharacterized membrane protein YphA (DoxX/SURF4 family)
MFDTFCKEKLGPLALRLALGFVCVYHGFIKIMAAGGTAWYPALSTGWQVVLGWSEFAAGLAILVGFRCRAAAAVVLLLTAGSFAWFQGRNVLRLPLHTLEPTLLLLLVGLAVLFLGAGGLSVDGRAGGRPFTPRLFKNK